MKPTVPEHVNKTACRRRFGWTRYGFDNHVAAGMPVVKAARHKGDEWTVDLLAVGDWVARREAAEAARRRRVRAYLEGKAREAERAAEAILARERRRERARREAEERRAAEWRAREARRKMEHWLDQAYGYCKRLAYRDIGRPFGPRWPQETPHWLADWPTRRPAWWLPPPGMLEAVMAEPEQTPFGYVEPDWRRWVPRYVPGCCWPWRADEAEARAP